MHTLESAEAEPQARAAVERLALLAAAAALADSAPLNVTESFARARLAGRRGSTYGTAELDAQETASILDRALPA
jgi:putative acyl-CoA dehydrogenase